MRTYAGLWQLLEPSALVPTIQALERPCRLARAEAAAVAEGSGEVALARAALFGLETRDRAKVTGPTQPVLGVASKHLQDAGRG